MVKASCKRLRGRLCCLVSGKLQLVRVEDQYKKVVRGFHCRTGLIDKSVLLRLRQQDRNACASTSRDI